MVRHISKAILIASGLITGLATIAAISYFRRQPEGRQESNTINRLRRSRHVRRRRNNNTAEEEDRPVSLFKEWGDDENRNLLNLLHAISENQSRKEGYIHRGITCNKCSVSPIRGTRYKCANCVDFDLCEMCEGSNSHVNTHVFLKIRIPIPPLANPRSALLPAFYPGKHYNKALLSMEKYKELQHSSHFDQIELEALYEQFKTLSTVESEGGGIDKETFEQCLGPLGLEKNLITERIFAFFDQDKDGIISFPEIVQGLSILCKGNLDEKIEYAFKGYDLDNDGYISRDELYRMYKSYFYLSMELVRDVVSAMEDEMMDSFEFSASQPVSAAFNVAIPSTSSDRRQSESDEDEDEDGTEAGPSTKKRKYPLKEDHFLKQYAIEAEQAKILSDASETQVNDMTADALRTDSQKLLMSNHNELKNKQKNGKKAWEEKFPIMETMTQGAINEMVDKTFKSIKTEREGYINFEEFKQCVQTDSSIVSWFEALGTVF
ncbi:hypothetical protein G6F46_005834 [Rhizopus delemar]|uniref:EF-hand n=2 Tax=Rhizopus TaxID=4842 RepID=A0A9P7CP84_9FUNG|nr:hypothetical protein G6F43_008422 [Rhizopus delemar]KAG1545994.1 hypothetical protein G6F51_005139 [Rhizopus arrhizus]KAG1456758.1 hypothetical protein G6F55_006322 [Rhizopus delemar]KAG1498531.1 hypothetical protein G6F54_005018 [Rhizopus delemar]KAG1509642.1 hypothetical protein G6F53_007287 [Rhizopus delemar]